eukprot:CAMPEP_0176343806 /NCGR_PEP_ID=MMETSP0126-20121128/4206_1 /TAXON_ID=141414 ORGANISM="Strombidinopsis acuminatum, Strain SPMC142" /NCGR_SAMPLE_ID=MMETSP0126 /ASSEMBLY_ACC=CAM_ASM_000229 /LENGTH=137 /DNA_ID=CAMNT_0017689911 /DNA_START=1681 /DNA_END=2094 /DNA_ORIENTATION=+
MGYLKNEKATWEVFDSEGYFHTGDTGFIDKEGFLNITGRLKEIIITSGGVNVSPLPIEFALKEQCPIISNCVVIGDERKYLIAIVTLKVKPKKTKLTNPQPSQFLAQEVMSYLSKNLNCKAETVEDAIADPSVLKYV